MVASPCAFGGQGLQLAEASPLARRSKHPARHPLRADEVRCHGEDPTFDREAYHGRNVIERLVGWLKECRRVATRFEKLALNYLAMLKWAMVRRCLRLH